MFIILNSMESTGARDTMILSKIIKNYVINRTNLAFVLLCVT